MTFISQSEKSKAVSRRGSGSIVTVMQSYKPSTKSQEMSFRISQDALSKIGVDMSSSSRRANVDVLYSEVEDLWKIEVSENGFTVSGKDSAPTGLVRYTVKPGHHVLEAEQEKLPCKSECDDSSLVFGDGYFVFKLKRN